MSSFNASESIRLLNSLFSKSIFKVLHFKSLILMFEMFCANLYYCSLILTTFILSAQAVTTNLSINWDEKLDQLLSLDWYERPPNCDKLWNATGLYECEKEEGGYKYMCQDIYTINVHLYFEVCSSPTDKKWDEYSITAKDFLNKGTQLVLDHQGALGINEILMTLIPGGSPLGEFYIPLISRSDVIPMFKYCYKNFKRWFGNNSNLGGSDSDAILKLDLPTCGLLENTSRVRFDNANIKSKLFQLHKIYQDIELSRWYTEFLRVLSLRFLPLLGIVQKFDEPNISQPLNDSELISKTNNLRNVPWDYINYFAQDYYFVENTRELMGSWKFNNDSRNEFENLLELKAGNFSLVNNECNNNTGNIQGRKFNQIFIEIAFNGSNETQKSLVENSLTKFKMELTHGGLNSYCINGTNIMKTTDPQLFSLLFSRNSEPINRIAQRIKKMDPIRSPYTQWTFKLRPLRMEQASLLDHIQLLKGSIQDLEILMYYSGTHVKQEKLHQHYESFNQD